MVNKQNFPLRGLEQHLQCDICIHIGTFFFNGTKTCHICFFLTPPHTGNHTRCEYEVRTKACQSVSLASETYPKVFLDKADTLVWFGRHLPLTSSLITL